MAALPLPVAILGDLISGSRKWGHPRWRPEAEGPPFSSTLHNRDRKTRPRSWMTSFPAPPSWIQDGGGGNDVIQDLGRFFRSLLWRWRKMAALPLPVAILDDLISGSRKWGHPRWRPEAEGPPFCATATIGVEKTAPGPGWRHFRPRHLGSKMATVEMTSRGRRDAREDVLQTSASSMSPVEVWLYWKHLIVSLTQALSKWLSELPACYYAEVISLHMSKVMKNLRLQQAPTLLFFWFYFFIFLTVLYNSLELLYSTVS